MKDLIAAVRKHAQENYAKGGWDVIVECYSDKEIGECIKGCTTVEEAIQKAGEEVCVHDEYRREIQATVW